jgi:hypothetical protein
MPIMATISGLELGAGASFEEAPDTFSGFVASILEMVQAAMTLSSAEASGCILQHPARNDQVLG